MKRIFLLAPQKITAQKQLRRAIENFSLLAIGSYLKSLGYEVRCFDMPTEGYENCVPMDDGSGSYICGSSEEELISEIDKFNPDCIGISVTFYYQDSIAKDISKKIKKYFPNIPLVGGGYSVSIQPDVYMEESAFDFLLLGEGEMRMQKLLESLDQSTVDYENIDGIAYRKNSKVYIKYPKDIIENLDELPMMDRSLIAQDKIISIGLNMAPYSKGERVASLFAGRGCPQRCTFCAALALGKKWRMHSVEKIIKEIEYLKETYNVDEIQFVCENLTANKKWAMELFSKMIPLNVSWCVPTGMFFNSIDFEMLDAMIKCGCYQLSLNIENGNKRVLKELMHKNVALERVKSIVDYAHDNGLAVHGSFMIGMPGESREEIQKTLKFPFDNNFDSITINIVNASKPSELYDLCEKKNFLIPQNNSKGYRSTNILIPPNHSDFSYTIEELEFLAADTGKSHFEWSKEKFPNIYHQKYYKHLQKHPENAEILKMSKL